MDEFYRARIQELLGECKPCPFCGKRNPNFDGMKEYLFVVCGDCGAEGPEADGEGAYDDAVKLWNGRQ